MTKILTGFSLPHVVSVGTSGAFTIGDTFYSGSTIVTAGTNDKSDNGSEYIPPSSQGGYTPQSPQNEITTKVSDLFAPRHIEAAEKPRISREKYRRTIERCAKLYRTIVQWYYGDREIDLEELRSQLNDEISQIAAAEVDTNEFLAHLYKYIASWALQENIVYFSSNDEIIEIIKALLSVPSNDNIPTKLVNLIRKHEGSDSRNKVSLALQTLKTLGFNRPPPNTVITKAPFSWPFDSMNITNEEVRQCIKVGENFSHAVSSVFYPSAINKIIADIVDDKDRTHFPATQFSIKDQLSRFYKGLKGSLRLLETFRRQLLGIHISEPVSVRETLEPLPNLITAGYTIWSNYPDLSPLIKLPKIDTAINSADITSLTFSVWEMLKNSFRETKIAKSKAEEYAASDETYLTFSTSEVMIEGKPAVVIGIRDRGRQIDFAKIMEKIQSNSELKAEFLMGWKSRDITLGQIVDLLSRRHFSIPLKDGKEAYSGIGLHSAREEILKHNGDLFMSNVEGGVETLIVIPKEGTKSTWRASDIPISGFQLESFSSEMAQATFVIMLAAIAKRLRGNRIHIY